MKITLCDARIIALQNGGSERDDYSGRGMNGRTCIAIECDDPITIIEAAAIDGFARPHVDSLGKGFIAYWPDAVTSPLPSAHQQEREG